MNAPLIAIGSIDKYYNNTRVLGALDWEIHAGQVVGLLGRNGAGKSTLIECLLGLRETDAGTVRIFGEDVTALTPQTLARIGYVPQQSDLFEWMTPAQMLAYFKALYPHWHDAKVAALLQRWGFDALKCERPISKLSGGEKQRLSIIRALAHGPALLVLDEPVAALDPVGRREFLRELVDGVIERDTTVLFSTHILSDLERVALDLAFLKEGRIALEGNLDSLLEQARRVTAPSALLAGVAIAGELRRQVGPDGLTQVVTRHAGPQLDALAAQGPGVRIETMSLEDLFVEVTQ